MNQPKTSRRNFLTSAAGVAAAAALPVKAQAPAVHVKKRPLNVLWVMTDDMRTEIGCYGSRFHAHTPNLDKLATQGVRFDRNYCQFPLCNPSRSSLFTGHPPKTTGVITNTDSVVKMHPEFMTIPRLFKESGYTTMRNGKLFHAGLDDPAAWTDFCCDAESLHATAKEHKLDIPRVQVPMPNGVLPVLPGDNARSAHSDQLLVIDTPNGEGAGDAVAADRTIELLGKLKNEPFFLGCGFSKPHSPPEAPQRFYDLYDPAKLTLPPDFAAWPTVPPGFPKAAIRMRNADLFIGRGATEDEARQVIRAYLASISWVDYNLGRVLTELDALGLRENTMVVFVADHGYQLGEKGKWSKAGSLFENGTRVPLFIHAPGMKGNGRATMRITESLNLYRTVTDLAGLEAPKEVEGRSMRPLLENPTAAWEHPAFSIWSEDGKTVHGTMVRTEQWRYAEFGKDAANGAMMFDVHADPMELTNVAEEPRLAGVRAELSRLVNGYSYGS